MQFAILGAPKGHAGALRTALNAIDNRGILTILHAGDIAVGGDNPNGAIALLEEFGVQGVQGEADRLAVLITRKGAALQARLSGDLYEAVAQARARMSATGIEALRSLPRGRRIEIDDVTIALCHGTVTNPSARIERDAPVDRLRRQREEANTDCVVFGKHDTAWDALVDTTCFICPGAMNAHEARYTIVDTGTRPWRIEHVTESVAG